MSHFNTCVLITRNGSTLEQLEKKADKMLAKFDIALRLPPYKAYVSDDEIQRVAKRYGIDPTNLPALAEKFEDWNGDQGGVDENGFYGISTKNPKGCIDLWTILTEVKPEDRGKLLFGQDDEEMTIKAIVLPDGTWIDGPWVDGVPDAEQEKGLEAWANKISTLIDEHKDSVVFLASCHL